MCFHQLHGKFDLQGDEYKNGQLWDFCVIPRLNSEALFECKVVSNLLELNEFELEEKVIDMFNTYVYPLKDDYIKFFNKGIKWHNITKNPYAPFPTAFQSEVHPLSWKKVQNKVPSADLPDGNFLLPHESHPPGCISPYLFPCRVQIWQGPQFHHLSE